MLGNIQSERRLPHPWPGGNHINFAFVQTRGHVVESPEAEVRFRSGEYQVYAPFRVRRSATRETADRAPQ